MILPVLVMLGLIVVGMPVAFALGVGALGSLLTEPSLPLTLVPQRMFTALDSWPIMAVPLFMLAGGLMDKGGMSRRIVEFASACFSFLRGSLGMVTVLASMVFAGISGSSTADTAAVGSIMLPAMREKGYDMRFAAALQAASGAIGPVIPPSILMIVIGYVTGTSVAQLFLAGVVPGVLIGLGLMVVAYRQALKEGPGFDAPVPFDTGKVLSTGMRALPAMGLPFLIVLGILGGIFTATEAAAAAVVYGLIVGIFLYREIGWRDLPSIALEAAERSSVVLFIAATAMLFAWLVAVHQVPQLLGSLLQEHISSRTLFLVFLNLALLLIGMFLESFSAVMVFMPILFPLALDFGIDPLHFGILATVNLAIGYITPPYGATLFVACGISEQTVRSVSGRVVPILIAMLAVLFIVTYLPGTVLWLPRMAAP
ncbi:MAG: TRAP transporter large permease [Gemmatimonadetes bacterium]|nr:TRAP transporter large permease [Gemmatimonadota bacterium]